MSWVIEPWFRGEVRRPYRRLLFFTDGGCARVLAGPISAEKWSSSWSSGNEVNGGPSARYLGFPRFAEASFEARFPFATIRLKDRHLPLVVEVTGWSPFVPGQADSASLPVVGVEYQFVNQGNATVEAVFSFNSENVVAEPFDFFALVWNYAQSIAHLFPDLERGLRETEFGDSQSQSGAQMSRVPLPIRPVGNEDPNHFLLGVPFADGQLGGILKAYRDWRISGDSAWLRRWWPRFRASLNCCINTWDPDHQGRLSEPHTTTYDSGELWGPDSMTASLYLGALKAVPSWERL